MNVIKDIERTLRAQKSLQVKTGVPPSKTSHDILIRAILSHEVSKIDLDTTQAVRYASATGPPSIELVNNLNMPFDIFFIEFTKPINNIIEGIFVSQSNIDTDRINVSVSLRKEDYITFQPFTINMKDICERGDTKTSIYADLLAWLLVYMSSDDVSLSLMPVSRQTRRYHTRKGIPLQKWYQVCHSVDLKKGEDEYDIGDDVIGHLMETDDGVAWLTYSNQTE